LSRDYRLLLIARVLRGFGFGFMAVVLGLYLEQRGLRPAAIGAVLALGLLTASLYGLPAAVLAARVGRRPVLVVIGLLMALSGLALAAAGPIWLLALAAATGMLGAASVDLGPFLALEQATLTESVPPARRNRAFGRYSLTGGLASAAGGLAAVLATSPAASRALLLLYAGLGLATSALALGLSRQVESPVPGPMLSRASARPLAGLAALFAVDSLGGGFVVQAVIAYWLHVRFGAGIALLGPTLAAIALVQAGSYEVASRLADRIGLIRTMVFTHLPSNVLLLLVPLSPNLAVAVAILVLRFSISQMDVPTRQAYVASIVPPAERVAALALTGSVRGVAQAVGPVIAGAAIQSAAYGLPFVLAGLIKIGYDLTLFAAFARRPAEMEPGRRR
jgi:MFS family permease